MRLLLDQDVYAATARFLRENDHDVVTASSIGCATASDIDLLKKAQELGRVLLTRDRDFGALVFLQRLGAGVIYLRIEPEQTEKVHAQLLGVLEAYSAAELGAAFIVVEPGRHRFRHPSKEGG